MPTIVPVVEGAGDVAALPGLLTRILLEKYNRADVIVAQGKSKVVAANGRMKLESKLEQFLQHAHNKPECAAILVLLDADDDCPVTVANQLSQRCEQYRSICPVQVVYADRSYESWFLASLDTIRGQGDIPGTISIQTPVESINNPKQWLTEQMPSGQAYKETAHQAPFSRLIDVELAYHNSRSFRRLCHALEQLLDGISTAAT